MNAYMHIETWMHHTCISRHECIIHTSTCIHPSPHDCELLYCNNNHDSRVLSFSLYCIYIYICAKFQIILMLFICWFIFKLDLSVSLSLIHTHTHTHCSPLSDMLKKARVSLFCARGFGGVSLFCVCNLSYFPVYPFPPLFLRVYIYTQVVLLSYLILGI